MSFYIKTNKKIDCFNCTACAVACPVQCIEMKKDEKDGYIYPVVDMERCIHCGKCERVCINLCHNTLQNNIKKSYVLYNKNEQVRAKSASGGISSILMEYVINKKGVVYGAAYNEELVVQHFRATTLEECEKFKTSKYVRSDILGIYEQVTEDLKNDKTVLFTGTPCQIAGIKSILSKKLQEKLVLCEIICDSVASPLLFEKFKNEVEKKYNSKIKKINFRSKENGADNMSMKIEFENNESVVLSHKLENIYSEYMQIFGRGLSAPESCKNCKFEHIHERTSDFTIGDYWGKQEFLKDDNKGMSFILLNTEKSIKIFEEYIKDKVGCKQVEIMEALNNNHIQNKSIILNKEEFMEDLPNLSFEELSKKYVRKYRWRTKLGKI